MTRLMRALAALAIVIGVRARLRFYMWRRPKGLRPKNP